VVREPIAARVVHVTGIELMTPRTKEELSGAITLPKVNMLDVSIDAKFLIFYFEILQSH
jgi:hypothetical protein